MALKYKVDVLAALNEKGYSTYRLRKDKLIGEATIQALRGGKAISWSGVETICHLLNCRPEYFIRYETESPEQLYTA